MLYLIGLDSGLPQTLSLPACPNPNQSNLNQRKLKSTLQKPDLAPILMHYNYQYNINQC